MASCPPRLRADLILRHQRTAQGTSAIIKDPASGKFFRLAEAEHFIARQLDGETSMEMIRQRTEAEFEATLPIETLNAFIENLKKNGVLETPEARKHDAHSTRFRGSILYCRFKVFDPCQLLNCMNRRAGFFYTAYFGVLSATAILLAAVIMITNWSDFRADLPRLYQFSTIPILVILNFLVVGAHEFGHGLTCTRFGGEVHEMGCALIFLQPAFYCNVSDAWLFPEKSKRLWVGFAGPYLELFLWALATLAWRITDADTPINFLALCVMATSGVKTLLNFNPLIKLDGYYLLSDYLEIPNLRRRSFRYVGSFVEYLFGLESPVEAVDNISRRERWIFAVYGSVALAGSFSILGYILASAGGSLVEGHTPAAVLATLVLLAMKFRRRFRRMFAHPSGGGSFDEDFDRPDETSDFSAPAKRTNLADNGNTPAESKEDAKFHILPVPNQGDNAQTVIEVPRGAKLTPPQDDDELKAPGEEPGPQKPAPEAKKSRRRSRWVRRTVWIALGVAAMGALFFGHAELRVKGPFNVLPIDNADVRAAIDGVVDVIYAHEGDFVRKGDLIARLADIDTRAALDKTEAQITQTNANLRKLEAGPTDAEIEVARANVTKAKDARKYAQKRLTMMQRGLDEKLISRKEYEETAALESAARNDLITAEDELQVLLNGSRPEDIEATKAQVEQLETDRNHLKEQRRLLSVYSPSTGIVATPTLQLKQLTHQLVKKGDLIAKVYDFRTVTAEIAVDEKDIADVQVNQKVVLRARAYPNEIFYGTVNFVATSVQGQASSGAAEQGPAALASPSPPGNNAKKSIRVTTEIDNHSLLLKPEMTGQAKVLCGRRRAFDLVTRRLFHTLKVEFWSWW